MPNWTTNRIIARTKKDWEAIKATLLKDGKVSFENLLPMPEDMRIECGWNSWKKSDDDSRIKGFYDDVVSQDGFVERCAGVAVPDDDAKHTKLRGYFNLRRHGVRDWYDWSVNNWGTKWDAYMPCYDDYAMDIGFQTAWTTPDGVISALAEIADFVHVYAGEGGDGYIGINLYEDNEVDELLDDGTPDEDFGMVCAINGYDEDEACEEFAEGFEEEDEGDSLEEHLEEVRSGFSAVMDILESLKEVA